MKIVPMREEHRADVTRMMYDFYHSDAVVTDGSAEIYDRDVTECVGPSPYAEGFVFLSDGDAAGYAMLALSFSTEYGKRCVMIEDLYIRPEYRRRGFGGRFFDFLGERYPGCVFRLEAEKDNLPAMELYRSRGFDISPYVEMKMTGDCR